MPTNTAPPLPDGSLHTTNKLSCCGFTLIELSVGIAIIALLIIFVAPALFGVRDQATASLLLRSTQKLTDNWLMIVQSCNASSDVRNTPLVEGDAENALALLLGGTNTASGGYDLPTGYKTCYAQSKVVPLSEGAQWNGMNWTVGNHRLGLGWLPGQLHVTFLSVPDSVALIMGQYYNRTLSDLGATANTDSNVFQYSARMAGYVRDVTVIRALQ